MASRFSDRLLIPIAQRTSRDPEPEPLFQLSIKLTNEDEPEVLKFYEGQDPAILAKNLQSKYPHVINS